jgi:hypothetical protein
MPGLVPDEGEVRMLRTVLGAVTAEVLSLRLYVNDKVPALDDSADDYVEMSGHGYAPIYLGANAWAFAMADPGTGTPARAEAPVQTFAFPAGGATVHVFGSVLVGDTSGILYGAARFDDGPYRVTNPGDFIEVTPRVLLRTGP